MILTTLLCLSGFLADRTIAADGSPIIIRGDANYPPYEYLNEKGEPDGFNVALTRAVARQMGLEITIDLGPWHEVRNQLESGGIDALMGIIKSEDRDRKLDFSIHHISISFAIFTRKNSKISSVNDITNRTILVQKGDFGHDHLKNNLVTDKITIKKDPASVLHALSKGEGDCALLPRLQGLMILKRKNISNIKAVGAPILRRNYCMAVTEGNSKLLATLNEGLNIVKSSGEYDRLYNQWFGIYEPRELSLAAIGIDLVIMDLTIPGGMGGREAAARILEQSPQAKLIVSSGYSNDPIMANHRDYGFQAAIVKPYQYEEFCDVVARVLAK